MRSTAKSNSAVYLLILAVYAIVAPQVAYAASEAAVDSAIASLGAAVFMYALRRHINKVVEDGKKVPLAARRKRGLIGITIGLICTALYRPFHESSVNLAISLSGFLLIFAPVFFGWGSFQLLKSKGYSGWFGVPCFLGFTHILLAVAIAVVIFRLPDRSQRTPVQRSLR